jgi:nucleoside-diphosphate-sugar epimerase
MLKVLLTGGAGFMGRHIAKRFLEAGDEVHIVDNIVAYTGGIDPGKGWPLFDPRDYPNFHFYREDCRAWFARVTDKEFDYVFHLAAVGGGRLMIEENPLAVADDLSIDASYWQWAKVARPQKTVCFSSSAAYPVKLQRPKTYVLLKEDMISFDDHIGMPDMTFGWAKLTCEYLARLAWQKHELRSVCFRPFACYGVDQDDVYPFPNIIKQVLSQRDKGVVQVWGSGTQMRDFIHIEDCIDGLLMTMDQIDDGNALNLSTGVLTSLSDLAHTAADIAGYDPVIKGTAGKPEGVHARGGDTTKQNELGFEYKIGFRAGIENALTLYDFAGMSIQ